MINYSQPRISLIDNLQTLMAMVKPPYQLWGFGKPDYFADMIVRWTDKTMYQDIDELYDAFRKRQPIRDWRLIVTKPNIEVDLMDIAPSKGIILVDTELLDFRRSHKAIEENSERDHLDSLLPIPAPKQASAQEIAAMFKSALEGFRQ